MYLKHIIAHGFKSFADKVNIDFGDGITGIVGPNGSGKSNVVDAVRWVLGEQSIKSLRGDDKMTDVIFSGSKSRHAMNVASVTLIFDNTDKYLNVPYEEVSITRRVYKDGTNEYLLNNERCRLKDITDVLLDTGVAKESFNIISQGKIEEILSSKPEDRRVIFEEAAGVLKYKKRKEEALRKLNRTNENMERVQDIIDELEVQVKPLKEQKEKACIYKEKQEQLKQIEVAVITTDIQALHTKYESSKKRLETLNEELLSITTTNQQNEATISKYKNDLAHMEENMNLLQKDFVSASTLVEKLNGQKQMLLERKKYEVDDKEIHQNAMRLKEEIMHLDTQISVLIEELTHEEESFKRILLHHDELKNREKVLKETKEKKNQELRSILSKIDTTHHTMRRLEEAIETSASLPFAVRSVLNEPRLSGIHDAISKLFETEERYTEALSIALGGQASYVVCENEIRAKEAIEYLKKNRLGRATFYPLNIIQAKKLDDNIFYELKKQQGFIGLAVDLISYAPIYDNIMRNVLGLTAVVDTIDHANAIAHKFHHRIRIVTLTGELLQPGGAMSGGQLKNSQNALRDKFDLEKAKGELRTLEDSQQSIEEETNVIDNELRVLEDKIYLSEKEKITKTLYIEEKKNQKEKFIATKTALLEELEGTKQVLEHTFSQEEERLMNAYYEALETKEKLEKKLEYAKQEQKNLKSSLDDFEFAVRKENSVFNSKNKEMQTLDIELNRMDVKLDNLLTMLSETYGMTFEHASYHYTLELEINTARNQITNLKRELKELGDVNLGAIEEYKRVSERYEFLLAQKKDLEEAIQVLLEIIDEMDEVMEEEFMKTFEIVKENFKTTFQELFRGGDATLKLTDKEHILETGIEIIASPPGKKLTTIGLLSGGEKTFTAISLLFAILKSRPVPFCILDEVEAALDEVNVDSFGKYVQTLKEKTQFILITHKKKTMEYADILYGITMQESGVSKLVSVKLEEIEK